MFNAKLIHASVAIERRGEAKRDVFESLDISELNLFRNGIYSAGIHYGEMTRMSVPAPRLEARVARSSLLKALTDTIAARLGVASFSVAHGRINVREDENIRAVETKQ